MVILISLIVVAILTLGLLSLAVRQETRLLSAVVVAIACVLVLVTSAIGDSLPANLQGYWLTTSPLIKIAILAGALKYVLNLYIQWLEAEKRKLNWFVTNSLFFALLLFILVQKTPEFDFLKHPFFDALAYIAAAFSAAIVTLSMEESRKEFFANKGKKLSDSHSPVDALLPKSK